MSSPHQRDDWQAILRLDWLREFAAGQRPGSASPLWPGLADVTDGYVAALRAWSAADTASDDALQDGLTRLGRLVTQLAGPGALGGNIEPPLVAEIVQRAWSRALEVSPLLEAALALNSSAAAGIPGLADAAAQNAAAVRKLCA